MCIRDRGIHPVSSTDAVNKQFITDTIKTVQKISKDKFIDILPIFNNHIFTISFNVNKKKRKNAVDNPEINFNHTKKMYEILFFC